MSLEARETKPRNGTPARHKARALYAPRAFTRSPIARLSVPPSMPPPRLSNGLGDRIAAWTLSRRAATAFTVSALVLTLFGTHVFPMYAQVRAGDIEVSYEPGWLTDYEAKELAFAHVRDLQRVEAVTGLRHGRAAVGVTALRAAGRDRGGADGIVLHFEGLDTDKVAGYRAPPHELVHVLASRLNDAPSPLMREGVAVYVAWLLDGGGSLSSVRDDLVALERSAAFGTTDLQRDVTAEYEAAGTVVRYLVETYGWEPFWKAYAYSGNVDTVARLGFGVSAVQLRCRVTLRLRSGGVGPQRAGSVSPCSNA